MFKDLAGVTRTVQQKFGAARVLVVGDLMLDRYLWGRVERISPEAPVPVVHVRNKTQCAGGAGNVAVNLSALGCQVMGAGLLGQDQEGNSLLNLLDGSGVDTTSIVSSGERRTTVKTRIVGGHQQMLRLDEEESCSLSDACAKQLLERVQNGLQRRPEVIVLSDYGKGTLAPSICKAIIQRARQESIPVLVDPKGRDYTRYFGATGICPNRLELARVANVEPDELDDLCAEGEKLRSTLDLRFIALTLSELGIALLEASGVSRFPAYAREVFDVSGAGDTVIATLAGATAAGMDLHDAAHLANLAAGIAVTKLGTAPITRDELLAALVSEQEQNPGKIFYNVGELLSRVARWRLAGETLVFTNGCFDILHAGHVTLLERARREGDRLIVALNTDRSVRALKGPSRPIVNEQERARVLAALAPVDAVVLFDDETPLNLIRSLRPEVLVKGGDYTVDQIVGANEVQSWKGRVAIVPLIEGVSTSALIRRANASN